MKITALYVRVSTREQNTDSQKDALLAYCKAKGWENIEIFEDKLSGAKCSRPRLDDLMKRLRSNEVERVVCYKLDRLGRSMTHLGLLFEEFTTRNVGFISTTENIDTSVENPMGKVMLSFLMILAEFNRDIIKERTRDGIAAAKARGTKFGRPFDPARQTMAQEIIELHKAGAGIRTLARLKHLSPTTISDIIRCGR